MDAKDDTMTIQCDLKTRVLQQQRRIAEELREKEEEKNRRFHEKAARREQQKRNELTKERRREKELGLLGASESLTAQKVRKATEENEKRKQKVLVLVSSSCYWRLCFILGFLRQRRRRNLKRNTERSSFTKERVLDSN